MSLEENEPKMLARLAARLPDHKRFPAARGFRARARAMSWALSFGAPAMFFCCFCFIAI
jgi:hypothetical protein